MNKTQEERVVAKLERDGYITRNECLRQYPAITRLSAIIQNLEKRGYELTPKWEHGDYKYTLKGKTDYEAHSKEAIRLFDQGKLVEA